MKISPFADSANVVATQVLLTGCSRTVSCEGPIRTDSILLAIRKEVKLNLISAHISQNVRPLPRHCCFRRNLLDSIGLDQNNRPLESVLSSAAVETSAKGIEKVRDPNKG